MEIILGSQSPRRRELMAGLNLPFTAITIEADESFPAELQAGDIPLYISRAKARAYANQLNDNQLLITADTIVWCDGKMLGKPADEQEARQMLRMLSNNTHQVYTAVTLLTKDGELDAFVDRTDVTFRYMTDSEIDFYIANCHPMDKAGAYAIQGKGSAFVKKINGDYFAVVGFPCCYVNETLNKLGIFPTK